MTKMKHIITWLLAITRACLALLPSALNIYTGPARTGNGTAIIAERAEASELKPGDRIVIVNEAGRKALSLNMFRNKLSRANVTIEKTQTRQVLTAMDADTAVFELVSAGGDGMYLKSGKGWLTVSENGHDLDYTEEPAENSRWEFRDDGLVANQSVFSVIEDGQQAEVFLEYYPLGLCFSAYRMGRDRNRFVFGFYRLGNSGPEETGPGDSLYRLPVFETSDLHGTMADDSGKDTLYLLAYISDKVKDVRGYGAEGRKELAVLLDGGDLYQGTTVSGATGGQCISAAFDLMGYDAVTIGNHEFDWGIEATVDADGTMPDYSMRQYAGENRIPVVNANLYRNGEKVSFAEDYLILEKTARDSAGNEMPVKIGVIGMAGEYGSSILYDKFEGLGYSITEDYDRINTMAKELEASGRCDATILLAHEQAASTAEQLGEDSAIDLVLGGHKHQPENWITADGLHYMAPAGDASCYVYCELAFAEEKGKPVFREVTDTRNVFTKDESGRLTDRPENAEELDPEIVALTKTALDTAAEIMDSEIGFITEPMARDDWLPESGERSSAIGNWVTSILARSVGAEIGFANKRGIRTSLTIGKGRQSRPVTLGDIHEVFLFDNIIFCFEITYEELLAVLEYSLTEQGQIVLFHMSGIDCYYTDRTVNALVTPEGEAVYVHGSWKDGWKEKKVRVAMPEYVATTNRPDGEMVNLFQEWKDTPRLLEARTRETEGAVRVLTEEAAANGSRLAVDTRPHYINHDYPAEP